MHEDVSDPRDLGPDPASHVSGNDVGGCHGEVRLDFDMQIDVVFETGLPRETLIDPDDARDARGRGLAGCRSHGEHGGRADTENTEYFWGKPNEHPDLRVVFSQCAPWERQKVWLSRNRGLML